MREISILLFVLFIQNIVNCQNDNTTNQKSPGDLLWSYSIDRKICSEPLMDNEGNIYYLGYNDVGVPHAVLYCFNEEGDSLWSKSFSVHIEEDPLIIPESGNIIVGTSFDCEILCVEPGGNVVWTTQINGYITQQPVVDNSGNILVVCESRLVSLNSEGDFNWDYYSSNGDITSPVSLSANGTAYFATEFSKLIGVSNLGTEIFEADLYANVRPEPTIDDDGTIYIATSSVDPDKTALQAFNPDGSEKWYMGFDIPNPSSVIIGNNNELYMRAF